MKLTSLHFGKSVLSVYAATFVNGVLGFLAVPVSLAFLGSEGYGLFSIYTLMVAYVSVADLGVGKNLLALLSREADAADRLRHLRTAVGLYSCLVTAWVVLLPALWWVVPGLLFKVSAVHRATVQWLTLLAVVETVIGVPLTILQTACLARQEFSRYSRFAVLSGMSRQTVLILGAAVFRAPVALAGVMAARRLLDVYLGFRVMGAVPREVWRPRLAWRPAFAMFRQSGSLFLGQMLYAGWIGAGSSLVNARFGLHWLGLYRAAFDLAAKSSVIANGITLVLFPKLSFALGRPGHRETMRRILRPALETSWAFYSTLGAAAALAAPWVLPLAGFRPREALVLFAWLAIGLSMNGHTQIANEIIQAGGRYRASAMVSFAGLAILVVVFAAGAGRLGPAAIGWAWIAAAAVAGMIADLLILGAPDFRGPAQAAYLAKKLMVAMLACVTLTSYAGVAPRGWSMLATAVLAVILAKDGIQLRRSLAQRGPRMPVAHAAEEQAVTA